MYYDSHLPEIEKFLSLQSKGDQTATSQCDRGDLSDKWGIKEGIDLNVLKSSCRGGI